LREGDAARKKERRKDKEKVQNEWFGSRNSDKIVTAQTKIGTYLYAKN